MFSSFKDIQFEKEAIARKQEIEAKKEADAQQAPIHADEMEQLKAKLAAEAEMTSKKPEAAVEEGKEAAEPLWDPVQGVPSKIAGGLSLWKPVQPEDNTPPQVAEFLRWVAEGEQDKAEAMLKADHTLSLKSGRVTDLSERTFKHITGFQYALWALDWNMWMMLLKYIPREEAQLQAMALDENGTKHGKHFDFSQLLRAYQTYEENYAVSEVQTPEIKKAMETHWCKQVGRAQLLLPAHAVNEYCRYDRAFDPLPDFKQEGLPRVREVGGKAGSDVYTQQYNEGKLGQKWAILRGPFPAACTAYLVDSRLIYSRDQLAATALFEARLQQQQTLIKKLLSNKPLFGNKG
ncbi:MAG: hypothetical protein K0R24_1460 [Gammaproteobacteria bacterium]|jgi:hypothetical protein|nr:hypothetical protein [Gammaproteobacteria bacterium]